MGSGGVGGQEIGILKGEEREIAIWGTDRKSVDTDEERCWVDLGCYLAWGSYTSSSHLDKWGKINSDKQCMGRLNGGLNGKSIRFTSDVILSEAQVLLSMT